MAGDGKAVAVGAFDEHRQVVAVNAFSLESADAARRPLVHFRADALGRPVRVAPAGPRRAEVGPRAVEARADLLAALDAPPRGHHAFRIDLSARERRRHAVGKKDQRVDRVFVDAFLAEEIDRVVRVQVEEAGQDGLVRGQPDDLCVREVPAGESGAHFEEDPVANDEAGVRDERVADRVEELPAGDDDVAGLERGGPLGGGRRRERDHRQREDENSAHRRRG